MVMFVYVGVVCQRQIKMTDRKRGGGIRTEREREKERERERESSSSCAGLGAPSGGVLEVREVRAECFQGLFSRLSLVSRPLS